MPVRSRVRMSYFSRLLTRSCEHCDSLVVVAKKETRVGKRLQIRNVPVSLHKDSPEARRLLGIE